jgi:hypothetical protein
MKNIEKYHYTQEALDVYNSLSLNNVPFNEWLQSEVEGMGEDTLLEASERVLKVYFPDHREHGVVDYFRDAIAREKAKPFRNCDKYRTKDEALMAFKKMCCGTGCRRCRFRDCGTEDACRLAWLYDESEKDEAK